MDRAPELDVSLSTGEVVSLRSLYEKERLALVFLRHFGCLFCREQVRELKKLPNLNIVFVTLAGASETEAFKKRMGSPHRFVCDPGRELHQRFDLKRGGLAQLVSPHIVLRTLTLMFRGLFIGMPQGDVKQLPGVFVIEPDGRVSWGYVGRDASDNPPTEDVQRHLEG